MGLDESRSRRAVRLALLGAGGLRAAFGSDGKSLQVGMAAATGLRATRLAEAGAWVPDELPTTSAGFEEAYGGRWEELQPGDQPAVRLNWIKAYPCCLQAHSAIEAAARIRDRIEEAERVTVTVHPVSRQAAPLDDVADGLQAKFSIPYLTAFALAHGPPKVDDFDHVVPQVRERAGAIEVRTDPSLLESEAVLVGESGAEERVEAALGSPARPMDRSALAAKVRSLAGSRLQGILDDPNRPVEEVLGAAGLR
jgi:2-methylcitrate dehydratase PrpD